MDFNIDILKIESSFRRIADELMNLHAIKIKDDYYRIVDCEFYFRHENHNDLYTHSHDEQIKNGTWYFHGSGMDITIGNKEQDAKGGILIRGIAKISDIENANGDFIEVDKKTIGSLNVITTLFSYYKNVFDTDNCFYLINNGNVKEFTINKTDVFNCPRKGLNKSKDSSGFHDKPYRFICFPYLPHSDKGLIEKYLVVSKVLNETKAKELFTLKYSKLSVQ